MLPIENDQFTPIVNRYLRINDKTWGDEKKGYLVRYRGQLFSQDSASVYDQLAQALRPLNVTPLFRIEDDQHAIILMKGIIQPKPTKVWGNIVFFFLTVISVAFTGAIFSTGDLPIGISGWLKFLLSGLPFALALMAILVCHEFGHYLAGRYHKTAVTLPFFIPFPLSYFGTMGAFIQLKEPPKNRRILLDIGIAGPLAGLVVALPVLLNISSKANSYLSLLPMQVCILSFTGFVISLPVRLSLRVVSMLVYIQSPGQVGQDYWLLP
jgi:Zn-dependent protease